MPAADFAAAQQRIAARRALRSKQHEPSSPWRMLAGRSGTRPAFRVGQVDAELLDAELIDLLRSQVGDALKFFGSHLTDTYAAEILLALRLVLFKLSIWNNNASYGAHLQGLRYSDARSSAPNHPPPKPWQKVAYGFVTVGARYAWTKWQDYLLAADDDDYTRPDTPRHAHHALLTRLTESLSSAHDVASLASFLVFLVNGRYRTLTDRLLRLRLTPTSHSASREVSFEYLNRQLVWHAFTEFLLFLLPLVGISRWRRILSRTARRLRTTFLTLIGRAPAPEESEDGAAKPAGELAFLPERTCAICYRDQNPTAQTEADVLAASAGGGVVGSAATDITNPYSALPCKCIYCFACIAQRIANQDGDGWTCLRCNAHVVACKPWDGDVLEPERREPAAHDGSGGGGGGGKSVGFASLDVGVTEKPDLAHVDPVPVFDAEHELERQQLSGITESQQGALGLEKTRGLDLGESLFSESEEWARADADEEDDDEQSEEYDEDEEMEGEELGMDE
jgi:peroxin-2